MDQSISDLSEVELGEIELAHPGEIQPEPAQAKDAGQAPSEEEAAEAPSPTACLLGFHSAVDAARCAATVVRWARGLDSSLLAYGGHDGAVRVVALDGGGATLLHTLRGHTRHVTDLDWSFNNAVLISASDDGTLALFDTSTWALTRIYNDLGGPLTCCRFLEANPNTVFVGTQLGTVVVLNTSTGALECHLAGGHCGWQCRVGDWETRLAQWASADLSARPLRALQAFAWRAPSCARRPRRALAPRTWNAWAIRGCWSQTAEAPSTPTTTWGLYLGPSPSSGCWAPRRWRWPSGRSARPPGCSTCRGRR